MRHSSRLQVGQRFEHGRHQRPKDGDIVARNINNDHSDRKAKEALLILEVADYRHLGYRYGTNLARTVVKAGQVVVDNA